MSALTSPLTSPLPAASLLELAHRGIRESALATVPTRRYAAAHLAALRAAAAVLACRARPARPARPRPTSAWVLLAGVAPELTEWAEFFALSARKRAGAEAGLPVVTPREADDLLRDAQAFLELVEESIAPARRPAQVLPAWADGP